MITLSKTVPADATTIAQAVRLCRERGHRQVRELSGDTYKEPGVDLGTIKEFVLSSSGPTPTWDGGTTSNTPNGAKSLLWSSGSSTRYLELCDWQFTNTPYVTFFFDADAWVEDCKFQDAHRDVLYFEAKTRALTVNGLRNRFYRIHNRVDVQHGDQNNGGKYWTGNHGWYVKTTGTGTFESVYLKEERYELGTGSLYHGNGVHGVADGIAGVLIEDCESVDAGAGVLFDGRNVGVIRRYRAHKSADLQFKLSQLDDVHPDCYRLRILQISTSKATVEDCEIISEVENDYPFVECLSTVVWQRNKGSVRPGAKAGTSSTICHMSYLDVQSAQAFIDQRGFNAITPPPPAMNDRYVSGTSNCFACKGTSPQDAPPEFSFEIPAECNLYIRQGTTVSDDLWLDDGQTVAIAGWPGHGGVAELVGDIYTDHEERVIVAEGVLWTGSFRPVTHPIPPPTDPTLEENVAAIRGDLSELLALMREVYNR